MCIMSISWIDKDKYKIQCSCNAQYEGPIIYRCPSCQRNILKYQISCNRCNKAITLKDALNCWTCGDFLCRECFKTSKACPKHQAMISDEQLEEIKHCSKKEKYGQVKNWILFIILIISIVPVIALSVWAGKFAPISILIGILIILTLSILLTEKWENKEREIYNSIDN